MESSLREKPEHHKPRRLSDYLKLEGKKKVHSLVDKVYHRTNLKMAWENVKSNHGACGVDKVTIDEFEENSEVLLEQLYKELKEGRYHPQPVRRLEIPKRGNPGKTRPLGIPSVYDRVCQQAIVNRIEPIFEEVFDSSSFGYRKRRQTKDALRKIWQEIQEGNEWIVDADLKDYFGSVDHEKLLTLIAQRIADGKVLKLIKQILEAGYIEQGRFFPTQRGTPQGGVISPCLSNILLTPFDKEMKHAGYQLTRWADDWVVTCRTRAEANKALAKAVKILQKLGVMLNVKKTRIVNIKQGFEFLGYKIKQGKGDLRLPKSKIKAKLNKINLYAIPTNKSIARFKEAVRQKTKRKVPLTIEEIVEELNPLIRGWGNYYKRSNVRGFFNQLDRWIIRRLWSHYNKKWRSKGWKNLPAKYLRNEMKLVSLISLIPTLQKPTQVHS